MATLRQKIQQSYVYTTENDTIVQICQLTYTDGDQTSLKESQDGVMMTLMQFC